MPESISIELGTHVMAPQSLSVPYLMNAPINIINIKATQIAEVKQCYAIT
jgi:hypothetical protein